MALEEYQKARKLAEKARRKASLQNRNPYLPCLNDILKNTETAGQVQVGLLEIPLSLVAGTVTESRQNAFADNFMPLMEPSSEFAVKWMHLYDAQIEEGIRDPIEVYEYMRLFYVQEGNKRVSVLKSLDVPSIEANITRILPHRNDDPAVSLYYEFLEFFNAVPIYDISFTRPGSYRKFASFLSRDLSSRWPDDLINTVRGAYFRFASVYSGMNSSELSITAGDAFLMYLYIYRFDSLLDCSREVIERRLKRMWNELLLEVSGKEIELRQDPAVNEQNRTRNSFFMHLPVYTEKKPMKVAFLYEGSITSSVWDADHDVGRIYLEKSFDGILSTWCYESCNEDAKIQLAIEDALKKGADAVFTTSQSMMPAALRNALHNPKTVFYNCSVNSAHAAVRTYYAREYEIRFLMGVLAAVYAENHRIGYLFEKREDAASGINAFAIGAAMIDPQVKVYLQPADKAENWQSEFDAQDIHIYSGPDLSFSDSLYPQYGLCMKTSENQVISLAVPVHNWGRYYEYLVTSVMRQSVPEDSRHAVNEWWGISSGVVDIHLSASVSFYTRRLIDVFRKGLQNRSLDPFASELHSQTGTVQKTGNEPLSSREILAMDWLNDNVIGSLAKNGKEGSV